MHKSKAKLFLFAFTTKVFVNLVGKLMLSEIIAFISLPFINYRKLFKDYPELKLVLRGLFILLAAQVFSDLYNSSAPTDYLRGWAVIIASMTSIVFLVYTLKNKPIGIIYYLFGIMLVNLFFGQGQLDANMLEDNSNYFKVRIVGFLNPAIILLACYLSNKKKPKISAILITFYGLFCMTVDARSNGLIFILSGVFLSIKISGLQMHRRKIISIGVMLLFVLYIGYIFYVNQVLSQGIGGKNAKEQLKQANNPYNPFELLFYGRTEAVVAVAAIAEKPLFGYGSWAIDKNFKYAEMLAEIKMTENIDYQSGFIPSHSLILTAWLFSGIIGFFALCYVMVLLFKIAFKYLRKSCYNFLFPIIVVMTFEMLWHVLFSPYGHLRTTFPIFAAFVIVLKLNSRTNAVKE